MIYGTNQYGRPGLDDRVRLATPPHHGPGIRDYSDHATYRERLSSRGGFLYMTLCNKGLPRPRHLRGCRHVGVSSI